MPRNNRRIKRSRAKITRKRIHNVVDGRSVRVGPDPPNYTVAPWWPITLVFASTGALKITGKSIFKTLKDQLPGLVLDPSAYIVFRVLSVRCWGKGVPINLTVYASEGDTSSAICDRFDLPGLMAYSRLGYKFSDEDQRRVFSSAGSDTIIGVDVNEKSFSFTYLNILLRFKGKSVVKHLELRSELSLEQMAF